VSEYIGLVVTHVMIMKSEST